MSERAPIVSPEVTRYLEEHVPKRPPSLSEQEAEAARTGFPIIGPAAGQFCYVLARACAARAIFELGSGTGYSTAWFARAVLENGGGVVHHTVREEDLSRRARTNLEALGLEGPVTFHTGDAVEALRAVSGPFDLIFLDIDKVGYPAALPVIAERLRPGGVLVADNVLWSGRIFDGSDRSPATEGIRAFTRLVAADRRFAPTIVPIRDGLMVAYRS